MTDKLHCPFCGAELESRKLLTGMVDYVCTNNQCDFAYTPLPIKWWQALIDGKKAQDALKACRKHISDIISEWNRQSQDYKSSLRKMVIFACRARDEITSITKQEK